MSVSLLATTTEEYAGVVFGPSVPLKRFEIDVVEAERLYPLPREERRPLMHQWANRQATPILAHVEQGGVAVYELDAASPAFNLMQGYLARAMIHVRIIPVMVAGSEDHLVARKLPR